LWNSYSGNMTFSIAHKLVAAFLGLTLVVLTATLGLARWSFEQGFLDYVNALEQARLEQIALVLGQEYSSSGQHWDFLSEDGFARLVRPSPPERGRGPPPRHGPPDQTETSKSHPPLRKKPSSPGSMHRGVPESPPTALFDMDDNLLVGVSITSLDTLTIRVAIIVDGNTIGELRSEPRRKFNSTVETDFSRQQLTTSWIIGLLCLALALGLSLMLARWLLAPVRRMINSVTQLSRGNYSHRTNENRSDELGQLTQNLDRLGSTLEANQSSRKRLLADVSHELRTPLTVLTGEIEALKDGLRNFDAAQLDSLDQEVQRLRYLVDDLYALSVSDVGGLRYQFAPLDLFDCLNNAIEGTYQRAAAQGVELAFVDAHIELPANARKGVTVAADGQRIDQLLLNLLENSLAYTDAPGRVTITLSRTQATAIVTIDDTAPGVNDSDCEKLFDPLYRQEGSRSRRTGGAGLGLAVCQNIVTAHGGSITASPSLLGGVRICIEFPLTGDSIT
jgi:two-component system sensor histidine kinase BaeS